MYETVRNRIAALEEEEVHGEEEERRIGASQSMNSNEILCVKCVKHADVYLQWRRPVKWSKACRIQWCTRNILIWYGHVLSELRFEALVQSITIVSGTETIGAGSRKRKAEIGEG